MNTIFRGHLRRTWPLALLGAVVIGLGLCEWQAWPFLERPLQEMLTKRLQRPVKFGDRFALHLLGSIRLDTSALRVGPPDGIAADSPLGGDLVNASDAQLALPYSTVWGLMRGKHDEAPRIRSLRFASIEASLKRLQDGRANWSMASASPDPGREFDMPRVDELVIHHGHLSLNDQVTRTELDASVNTTEGDRAAGSSPQAGLAVDGRGRHDGQPFDFHVESSGVLPLVASQERSVAAPLRLKLNAPEAKLAFDGSAIDVLSLRSLDGDVTLSGASLAKVGDSLGVTLPTTAPFILKGRLGKSGEMWQLKQADLHVGDSHLGGEFSYDHAPKTPLLSGELTSSHVVLADLAPAFGAGAANPPRPAGRVLPQREFDVPSLHAMDADLKLRLHRADLGSLFRQPLDPLQGDLSLRGGVLKISNLLARTAGGEIKGSVGLDANPPQPRWNADVRWAGVELEQWLRPRNKASLDVKPSGEKPGYLSGRLGGHAKLQGQGKSTAKLLASLDGTVQAWVRNGTISHLVVEEIGLDIAQGLGVLVKGDDKLPMTCALLKADARDGKIVPEVAIIDTRDSTVLVSGWVSLLDEDMALTLTARPKDMSPATLRSPVKLEGHFATPKVSIAAKPFALKVVAAAALAAINPLAALIPLIDTGDKDAGACERTLQRLRDADGPAGTRDAKAPRPGDKTGDEAQAPHHAVAAASAPIRK